MGKTKKMQHLFDPRVFGDVKKIFTAEKTLKIFYSPRMMMTLREEKTVYRLRIQEEWIVPEKNLVGVGRAWQSDHHTNRTQRISDTQILSHTLHIWDTRSVLKSSHSFFSWIVFQRQKKRTFFKKRELFLKKGIWPSSVKKRLGVHKIVGFIFDLAM